MSELLERIASKFPKQQMGTKHREEHWRTSIAKALFEIQKHRAWDYSKAVVKARERLLDMFKQSYTGLRKAGVPAWEVSQAFGERMRSYTSSESGAFKEDVADELSDWMAREE